LQEPDDSGPGYALAVDATTTQTGVAPLSVRREGLAWAFAGVLMFSFSVPLTKEAVGGFSPYLTATGRAVIAGAIAAVLLAATRAKLPPPHLRRPIVFTMLGAVFGWPILLALALERTTSAHVAVIAAFMPLTTALIAVMRTHERVSWQFWAAAWPTCWWSGRCSCRPGATSRGRRSRARCPAGR
jgi:uncharacterized membrane protein